MSASRTITLEEAVELRELFDRHEKLMTAEEFDAYIEYKAEQEAEGAWLRYAENLGWKEAYLESLVESGFISRY